MNTFLIVSAVLFLLLTWSIVRTRARRKAQREACQKAFDGAYAKSGNKPSLEAGYGYGVPTFKVTHSSREAHELSELSGANAEFRRGIQAICGASGSKANPYQATRAIHYAWLTAENEAFFPPPTALKTTSDA